MKKHFIEIDALKGWAIFLVVLGHAIIVYPIDLQENLFWGKLFSLISSVHIPLFFTVSGYCFSFRGDYKTYLIKKVKRLLIPYFVFCLAEAVPVMLLGALNHNTVSFGESIRRMLFYGGYYWFLWTLFLIFLIFPFLHKLFMRNTATKVVGTIIFVVLTVVRIPLDFWCLDRVSQYLIYFWAGDLLRSKWSFENRPSIKVSSLAAILCGTAWVILCLLPLARNDIEMNTKYLFEAVLGIVASAAATGFTWFIRFFAKYGKYSLQLYLLNSFLLGASRAVVCNVLHIETGIVIVAFNMLVDFFLSYLMIKYVFSRFRFTRELMGIV